MRKMKGFWIRYTLKNLLQDDIKHWSGTWKAFTFIGIKRTPGSYHVSVSGVRIHV